MSIRWLGEVGSTKNDGIGAVFFHQQFSTLRGEALLLAFGTFDERPNALRRNRQPGGDGLLLHRASPLGTAMRERIRLGGWRIKKRNGRSTTSLGIPPM